MINNYSGYFRLARALSASKEYEAALKELATAASLAPGTRLFQNITFDKINKYLFHFDLTTAFLEDKAITKEQQAIKAAQKKYNEGEKKKFAKMFG